MPGPHCFSVSGQTPGHPYPFGTIPYPNESPRKDDYVWNNKKAEDLYKNPYFRNGEGDWTPQRKKEAMNNVRK